LGVLILVFGPVSGAHFNPVVSLVDWWLGRRERAGLKPVELAAYAGAQVAGAIGGAVLANLMFDLAAVSWSTTDRSAGHLWLGEVVATGLILLIFALARSGRATVAVACDRGLYRRGVLVHQLDQLRQSGGHHRPGVHRHIRRDRTRLTARVRGRASGWCRLWRGAAGRAVPRCIANGGRGRRTAR
jgi:hypothetical protein